jgi:hypothetical protein
MLINLNLFICCLLAPSECLQYFTASTGRVKSFNWVANAVGSRQLNNQKYNICLRTELTSSGSVRTISFQKLIFS